MERPKASRSPADGQQSDESRQGSKTGATDRTRWLTGFRLLGITGFRLQVQGRIFNIPLETVRRVHVWSVLSEAGHEKDKAFEIRIFQACMRNSVGFPQSPIILTAALAASEHVPSTSCLQQRSKFGCSCHKQGRPKVMFQLWESEIDSLRGL